MFKIKLLSGFCWCRARSLLPLALLVFLVSPESGATPPSGDSGAPLVCQGGRNGTEGPETWLCARLAELATDRRIRRTRVGLAVYDLKRRAMVASRAGDIGFNIASNVKLLTTAASLKYLGGEHRFATSLRVAGKRRPVGTVKGDLYVVGRGDPMLRTGDLWGLVQQLYDTGIRSISGGVTLVEDYFDAQREAPLFDSKESDQWYRTTTGALALDHNILEIRAVGAEPGKPAHLLLSPPSAYFSVTNRTVTSRGWVRPRFKVITGKGDGRMTVEVKGKITRGVNRRVARLRIEDPGLALGHVLLDLLRARGISVKRDTIRRGKAPTRSVVVGLHRSMPLSQVLARMNKSSDNFVAEQVLRVMGAEVSGGQASSAAGLQAVTRYLASVGVSPGSYTLKNGSGLYDASRVSPHQLVKVLAAAHGDFKIAAEALASLAVAGVDGTLGRRFRGGGAERYVRAKTGTLSGVVTLSGYVGGSGSHGPLAFAIFINDLPWYKLGHGRKALDAMVEAMVSYLERD